MQKPHSVTRSLGFFNGTSGTEIAEVVISKIKQAVNAITFR